MKAVPMRTVRQNPQIGLFLGASIGFFLEFVNITVGGLTATLPGGFRLHHIWIGLILVLAGAATRTPVLIGLGIVLMVGDWIEHQRPDGTVAPFW